MPGCYALVVAAGRGHRFGGSLPKQYCLLGGIPVLRHTLRTLLSHPGINGIACVIHPDDQSLYQSATEGLALLPAVPGGAERQDSVRLGLESLAEFAPDRVLIHDAARPFVDARLIDRVIDALDSHIGVIPALPVTDTLKRGENDLIGETVSRSGLFRAQTPQAFRFAEIIAAHRAKAGEALTDDAAVLESQGHSVGMVEGSEANVKLTTQEDLMNAESRQNPMETRVGSGYDVHRLGPGTFVTLCGIEIPHSRGLVGHSDADVGLHALTDALLGAIAEGDIGSHFPPSDPQWKGAASDRFLAHAAKLVAEKGGRIVNVDVTLICEAPKIGPHRETMRKRIADILGVPLHRVALKATTTEKLGFTGREEGIAALASAAVALPCTLP